MLRSKEMNTWSGSFISIAIVLTILASTQLFSQGKYLRGEIWQKFDVENATADFYVSPDGNDDWSGTLETPNSSASDGPFQTIKRAQKAVRELKKEVYKPEDIPIDTRYAGSPHTLGSGKDIVVLIRDGYYQLSELYIDEAQDTISMAKNTFAHILSEYCSLFYWHR